MGFVRVLREFERDGVRVVAREHVSNEGTPRYSVEASVASEFHSRMDAASEEDAKWQAERLFDAIYLREYGEGPRSPGRANDQGVSLSGVTERG
jgi:predicted HD phosphohydrolase